MYRSDLIETSQKLQTHHWWRDCFGEYNLNADFFQFICGTTINHAINYQTHTQCPNFAQPTIGMFCHYAGIKWLFVYGSLPYSGSRSN